MEKLASFVWNAIKSVVSVIIIVGAVVVRCLLSTFCINPFGRSARNGAHSIEHTNAL